MAKQQTIKDTAPANDNAPSTSLATLTNDALGGLELGADADDGLGEADQSDYRDAALVLNFKGKDKNGRAIPPDVFYNTISETTHERVHLTLCLLHKTNLYSKFDKARNKTDIICRSFDRVQGTMDNGTIRPCEGCPDAKWYQGTGDDGKPKRMKNCSEVYNLMGVDRDTAQPVVVRFKKTALPVIKTYLQKHHLGRRLVKGKRLNYPLYAFSVTMTAKLAADGATYAVPILERGDVLTEDEIRVHAENTKALNQRMRGVLERLEDQVEGREVDTSFDVDAMAEAEGQDFVESKEAAS